MRWEVGKISMDTWWNQRCSLQTAIGCGDGLKMLIAPMNCCLASRQNRPDLKSNFLRAYRLIQLGMTGISPGFPAFLPHSAGKSLFMASRIFLRQFMDSIRLELYCLYACAPKQPCTCIEDLT